MPYTFESREEFQKNLVTKTKRPVFIAGDYIAKLAEITPGKLAQTYDSFMAVGRKPVEELTPEDIQEVVGLKLQLYSTNYGEPITDIDAEIHEGLSQILLFDISPSTGFNGKSGEPHKLRSLIAYATKNDPTKAFNFEGELTDLTNAYVGIRLIQKLDGKGKPVNRLDTFTRLPANFAPDAGVEAKGVEAWNKYQEAIAKSAAKASEVAGVSVADAPF